MDGTISSLRSEMAQDRAAIQSHLGEKVDNLSANLTDAANRQRVGEAERERDAMKDQLAARDHASTTATSDLASHVKKKLEQFERAMHDSQRQAVEKLTSSFDGRLQALHGDLANRYAEEKEAARVKHEHEMALANGQAEKEGLEAQFNALQSGEAQTAWPPNLAFHRPPATHKPRPTTCYPPPSTQVWRIVLRSCRTPIIKPAPSNSRRRATD